MIILVGEGQDVVGHGMPQIINDGDERQVHAMLLMHEPEFKRAPVARPQLLNTTRRRFERRRPRHYTPHIAVE